MPIATEQDHGKEWIIRHESNYNANYKCGECGGRLIACWGGMFRYKEYILRCVNDISHSKINRDFELTPANTPGFTLYDAGKKRREKMEQQKPNAVALRKYQGVINLTREQATEILQTLWPGAPQIEMKRAAMLCADYQLNPLMKHLFLIPFNKGSDKESWATVMGINATRLLASRKGTFSYVDDTPRVMTEDEQQRRFGQVYTDRLYVIVKLMDPKTKAEAVGLGFWLNSAKAYGEDKGNTVFNMAAIRAERQALSRLRPGEMPSDVEVMEDSFAEQASITGVDDDSIIDSTATEVTDEVPQDEQAAEPEQETPVPKEQPAKSTPPDKGQGVNDETAITSNELKLLNDLIKEKKIGGIEIGGIMANTLQFRPCPRDLKLLTKSQYDKLINYLRNK